MSVTQVLTAPTSGGLRNLRVDPRALVSSRLVQVVLLVALTLGLSPLMRSDGGVLVLRVLVAASFGLLCMRWFMAAALALLFLSADGLGLLGASGGSGLPYLQVLPALRLTIRDVLLVATLPMGLMILRRRRELPVFTMSLLGVAAAILFAFALGVASDGDTHTPFNMLRTLFEYVLYFTIVAAVDTRPKLHLFVWALLGIAGCAVAIQLAQLVLGPALPFVAVPSQGPLQVDVGGELAAYAWNPAPLHMFLGMLVALGCVLERGSVRYLGPAMLCLAGFTVGLTRSWYVFSAAAVVVMVLTVLVAHGPGSRTSLRSLALLLLPAAVVGFLLASAAGAHGNSALPVWAQRAATLFAVQNDASYQSRLLTLSAQWRHVFDSPLFGYGLSSAGYQLVITLGRNDTGMVNTLLLFGAIGTMPFLLLILRGFSFSIRMYRRLTNSLERGYVLGLAGVWVGLAVGYVFDWDFMSGINGYNAAWLPILALAILDRAARFGTTPAVRN